MVETSHEVVDAPGDPARRRGLAELRRPVVRDGCWVLAGTLVMILAVAWVDAFERIYQWSRQHEHLQVDEVLVVLAGTHLLMMGFGFRRTRELKEHFREREPPSTRWSGRACVTP